MKKVLITMIAIEQDASEFVNMEKPFFALLSNMDNFT